MGGLPTNKYISLSNNLLRVLESGFREKFSCETTILVQYVATTFLYSKRAFETINRLFLYKKLQEYGIEGRNLSIYTAGNKQ